MLQLRGQDKQTGRQTDRQTGRQAGRQTDKRNARPKPRTTMVVVWRADTQLPGNEISNEHYNRNVTRTRTGREDIPCAAPPSARVIRRVVAMPMAAAKGRPERRPG